MRSFTTAGAPGRCARCLVVEAWCVCALVPTVQPRTDVVIVRHEREGWKSTGTARIAALAISSLRIVDYGEDPLEAERRLQGLVRPDAVLLFPTDDAVEGSPSTPAAPTQLLLIDGTWRQTRKMYSRLTSLHPLRKLALSATPPRSLRLRESNFEAGRSTLEALAEALGHFEGEGVAAPLLQLHRDYVERVFRARGVWEQKRAEFEQR